LKPRGFHPLAPNREGGFGNTFEEQHQKYHCFFKPPEIWKKRDFVYGFQRV
jgi:hypothetical protein